MAFWRNLCESLSVSRIFKPISFSYLWFITIINWGSKFFWWVWSSTHRVLTHHLHSQLHTSRRFDPWWRMRMDVLSVLNLPSSLGNVSIWRTDSWLMIRILVETFWDLNVEMVHFFEVWRGEAHTRNVQTLTAHAWNIHKTNGSVLIVTIWCVTWVSFRRAWDLEKVECFESLGCDSAHTWYIRGIYCQVGNYMLPTTFCKNLKNLLKSVLPWAPPINHRMRIRMAPEFADSDQGASCFLEWKVSANLKNIKNSVLNSISKKHGL